MVKDAGPPLTIVFFGTPVFAVPALARLLTSGHRVAAVVTQPDRPRGRGQRPSEGPVKALARSRGLRVLQPERIKDPAFLGELRALAPDLGVVAAYGRILPDELLVVPRLGLVNIHASLLPKYRGAAPVQRAIIAGETRTGVSIMRVVRALDSGPVFATRTREIGPDETAAEVEHDLAELGAAALAEVIETIAAGTAAETPQIAAEATSAPKMTKEEGRLDWREPAPRLHDRVRGLHPWPHAFTYHRGRRYVILRSAVEQGGAVGPTFPPSLKLRRAAGAFAEAGRSGVPGSSGTILTAHGDALVVAAGEGTALRILEIQPEGKRPMKTREFLAGHRLAAGQRFGPPDAAAGLRDPRHE